MRVEVKKWVQGEWTSYQKEGQLAQHSRCHGNCPLAQSLRNHMCTLTRNLLQKQGNWKGHFLVAFGGLRGCKLWAVVLLAVEMLMGWWLFKHQQCLLPLVLTMTWEFYAENQRKKGEKWQLQQPKLGDLVLSLFPLGGSKSHRRGTWCVCVCVCVCGVEARETVFCVHYDYPIFSCLHGLGNINYISFTPLAPNKTYTFLVLLDLNTRKMVFFIVFHTM